MSNKSNHRKTPRLHSANILVSFMATMLVSAGYITALTGFPGVL